jgi:GTP cyclohydrolase II
MGRKYRPDWPVGCRAARVALHAAVVKGNDMTDKQPEALRLADELEAPDALGRPLSSAAAELRRLYAHGVLLQQAERIQDLYRQIEALEKQLDDQYKLGMEAEREACAKVCQPLRKGSSKRN